MNFNIVALMLSGVEGSGHQLMFGNQIGALHPRLTERCEGHPTGNSTNSACARKSNVS